MITSTSGNESEGYDFEFEDDDDDDDYYVDNGGGEVHACDENQNNGRPWELELENAYYSAKSELEIRGEHAKSTLFQLENVLMKAEHFVEQLGSGNKWVWKSLKRICKVHLKNHNFTKALCCVGRLTSMMKNGAVSSTMSERGMTSVLKVASCQSTYNVKFLEFLYKCIISSVGKNSNLFGSTMLRLGQLFFYCKRFNELADLIQDFGTNSSTRIERVSLQVLLHVARNDNRRAKTLVQSSLNTYPMLANSHAIGVIREGRGRVFTREGRWEAACSDFFEAFKCYSDAVLRDGQVRCLTYVLLCGLYTGYTSSTLWRLDRVRYFDDDPRIVAFKNICKAFSSNNLKSIRTYVWTYRSDLMEDHLLSYHVDKILYSIESTKVENLASTESSLSKISSQIDAAETRVEEILRGLILNGKVVGKIDQKNLTLVRKEETHQNAFARRVEDWSSAIEARWSSLRERESDARTRGTKRKAMS